MLTFLAFGDWGRYDAYPKIRKLIQCACRVPLPSKDGAAVTNESGDAWVMPEATTPSHYIDDPTSITCAPQAVVALGDNFYSQGVATESDDRLYKWCEFFGSEHASTPWFVVPGNHDYHPKSGIKAQLRFSDYVRGNPLKKWTMGTPSSDPKEDRCPWGLQRLTAVGDGGAAVTVDLLLLDTCATQYSVRRAFPDVLAKWPEQRQWLLESLKASDATWKVVCGHHPLFTVGRGHQDEARCLRGDRYTSVSDPYVDHKGMGLLETLHTGGADVYLSGHEHWFAAGSDEAVHAESGTAHRLEAVLCGNIIESRLWLGRYEPRVCDDFDDKRVEMLLGTAMKHAAAIQGGDAVQSWNDEVQHNPRGTLDALLRGEGALSQLVDPHRSVFSTATHVDVQRAEPGILRVTATQDCLHMENIDATGHVAAFRCLKKRKP